MEYCLVLISLFEPWANGPDANRRVNGHTIHEVGTLARARLETLIRLYYLRHSFDSLDVMLIMFLLLLGSISMRVLTSRQDHEISTTVSAEHGHPSQSPRRDASTFLLCAKGLHDQGQNQYLGSLMFNMLSGLVDPANEALVSDLAKIKAEFTGTEVKPEYVHMDWPVYTWVHPENQSMGRLLEAVEGLSVDEGDEDEGQGREEGGGRERASKIQRES